MLKTKESKGITLIALIITIIVLLILAGVTINALSGNDSTPAKAQEATQKTDISSAKEDCILTATTAKTDALHETYVANNANKTIAQSVIDELIKKNNTNIGSASITVASDGTVIISTTGYEVIGTVDENGTLTFGEVESLEPEIKGLTPQVGDIVNYAPSGQYNWQAKYASSDLSDADTNNDGIGDKDILLASGTTYSNLSDTEKAKYDSTSNMSVTQWKVLNYDPSTKMVELVPTAPVGSLRLQGTQGYNNAVKMLDDACSSLYGNSAKGITARSIKEEDFVKAGKQSQEGDSETTNDWTRARAIYNNGATYDNTESSAYTKAKSWYPNIHANEYGNGLGNSVTLGLSEQTGELIERKVNDTENSKFQANNGIQPKQTYYNTSNYNTTAGLLKDGKAAVLFPNTSSTDYWVASRCVNLNSSNCSFRVRHVNSGSLNASFVFYSYIDTYNGSRELFPVVSLRVKRLDLKSTNNGVQTFDVK